MFGWSGGTGKARIPNSCFQRGGGHCPDWKGFGLFLAIEAAEFKVQSSECESVFSGAASGSTIRTGSGHHYMKRGKGGREGEKEEGRKRRRKEGREGGVLEVLTSPAPRREIRLQLVI